MNVQYPLSGDHLDYFRLLFSFVSQFNREYLTEIHIKGVYIKSAGHRHILMRIQYGFHVQYAPIKKKSVSISIYLCPIYISFPIKLPTVQSKNHRLLQTQCWTRQLLAIKPMENVTSTTVYKTTMTNQTTQLKNLKQLCRRFVFSGSTKSTITGQDRMIMVR